MYKKVLAFVVVVALLAIGFGVASQPSVAQMKIVYNSYASDPVPRATLRRWWQSGTRRIRICPSS